VLLKAEPNQHFVQALQPALPNHKPWANLDFAKFSLRLGNIFAFPRPDFSQRDIMMIQRESKGCPNQLLSEISRYARLATKIDFMSQEL
jgi:hypothetical protein